MITFLDRVLVALFQRACALPCPTRMRHRCTSAPTGRPRACISMYRYGMMRRQTARFLPRHGNVCYAHPHNAVACLAHAPRATYRAKQRGARETATQRSTRHGSLGNRYARGPRNHGGGHLITANRQHSKQQGLRTRGCGNWSTCRVRALGS